MVLQDTCRGRAGSIGGRREYVLQDTCRGRAGSIGGRREDGVTRHLKG